MISPDSRFFPQAKLLLEVLPFVAEERCFALKGGTAINFFVRDLPRLSVDIDLTYLPIAPYDESLQAISGALHRIRQRMQDGSPTYPSTLGFLAKTGCATKLFVNRNGVRVTVEVTPVLRGAVLPAVELSVTPAVERDIGFARIQCLSFADLYGGKIVAALDRQHPRDLFDVSQLLANEGIDAAVFTAFLTYLISHDSSIARVLDPARKDLRQIYNDHFLGMAAEDPPLESLLEAREALIRALHARFDDRARTFLVSFKRLRPQWDLLDVPGAADLPAVRWRLRNIERMGPQALEAAATRLEEVLARIG